VRRCSSAQRLGFCLLQSSAGVVSVRKGVDFACCRAPSTEVQRTKPTCREALFQCAEARAESVCVHVCGVCVFVVCVCVVWVAYGCTEEGDASQSRTESSPGALRSFCGSRL
jgi:hypothetical protein